MMLINEFFQKYKLRNQATSNIKFYQVLLSLSLKDLGIYLRDVSFSSDIGIVNLHPSK